MRAQATGEGGPDTFVCDAEGDGHKSVRSPMDSDTYVGNQVDNFSDCDRQLRAANYRLVSQGWKRPEKLRSISVVSTFKREPIRRLFIHLTSGWQNPLDRSLHQKDADARSSPIFHNMTKQPNGEGGVC
jgi:hypothetical protein